jgi:hypothetical protein
MAFKRRWLWPLLTVFVLLGLVVATPFGSWFAGRLIVWGGASAGWDVAFEKTSGTLVGGVIFYGLTAIDADHTVDLSLERLAVHLRAYRVDILGPNLVLTLKADSTKKEETPASDLVLPISLLPEATLRNGRFSLRSADLLLQGEGLEAAYRATADTSGRLSLSLAQFNAAGPQPLATGYLEMAVLIQPRQLKVESLKGRATADSLVMELEAGGLLGLDAALPLDITLRTQVQADSAQFQGKMSISGALVPLALGLQLNGKATEPSIGPLSFFARARVDSERVQLDSLHGALFGGQLDGRAVYHILADSLEAQARLTQLELAKLPQSPTAGQLDLELTANANLAAERYAVQLDLNVQDMDLLDGEPLDVRLNARLHPDHQVEAALRSAIGALNARGWAKTDGSFDLALTGEAKLAAVLGVDLAPLRMLGRVVPDTLELRLDTDRLPSEVGSFGALWLELGLQQWRYLQARGALEEQLVRFNLGMDVETAQVDSFQLVLAPLALARLEPQLTGHLQGRIHGAGSLVADTLEGAGLIVNSGFTLERPGYDGWQSESLSITLDYAADAVRVLVDGPTLQSQAEYNTETRFLKGEARFDGPLVWRPGITPDTEGALRDELSLDGRVDWRLQTDSPDSLEADLALDGLQARLGGWELSAAGPLLLGYKDRQVKLERLRLNTPVGPLVATGRVRQDALDLEVELERLNLADLVPGSTLAGHSFWRFAGSVAQPRVEGQLVLQKVALDTLVLGDVEVAVRLADSLHVQVELIQAGDQVPKAEFSLAMPAAPLLAGLADSTEGRMHLDLDVRQTQWDALMTHVLGQPATARLDMKGRMILPLGLIRDPLAWDGIEGYLQVNEGFLELPAADSLRVWMQPGGKVRLNGDSVELRQVHVQGERYDRELETFRRIGTLGIDGSLHTEQSSRLSLVLNELDLGAVVGPEDSPALKVVLNGTLKEFDLSADLDVHTLDLGGIQGHLAANNQGGQLDLNWSTPMQDSLKIEAQLPWQLPRGKVDMAGGRAQVHTVGIGLSAFKDLLPQLDDLQGRMHTDLRFEGFDDSLKAWGVVGFDSLKFALVDLQPAYLVPAGRLIFEGRHAVLKDFVGGPEKGRGELSLEGGIDLAAKGGQLLDITLKTKDLPLRFEDIFKVPDIDIGLRFVGGPTASQLKGHVHLSKALMVPPLIEFNAPPTTPPPPTVQNDFMENMALDVEFDIRQLKVDSELAQVEISGGGNIGGTFYKPTFQADWSIDEGYVLLLNRQFDFEEGRISLNHLVPTAPLLDLAYDPLVLDPDLDIRATTKVVDTGADDRPEYTVSLNLQGPLLTVAPEFSAESSDPTGPALEFDQIITLLAFSSIEAVNPAYGTALGTAAGQLLLSKRIEDVGLDEFNILPSGTSLSTVGEPSVLMGKFLKDLPLPLWVRYEAAIKDFSLGEVRVEHRLNSIITISGSAESAQERYGLGIGLKKAF